MTVFSILSFRSFETVPMTCPFCTGCRSESTGSILFTRPNPSFFRKSNPPSGVVFWLSYFGMMLPNIANLFIKVSTERAIEPDGTKEAKRPADNPYPY